MAKSASSRAGLLFPVPKVLKLMKKQRLAGSVGKRPSIVLAAAMEYLAAEVLELSGNIAVEQRKKTIKPRAIMLAIVGDDELNKLVGCKAMFTESGVLPHIEPAMLKNKGKNNKAPKNDEIGTQEV